MEMHSQAIQFKKFSGGGPPDPLMRGTPLLCSPPLAAYAARNMPLAVNAPPSSDLLGPALYLHHMNSNTSIKLQHFSHLMVSVFYIQRNITHVSDGI